MKQAQLRDTKFTLAMVYGAQYTAELADGKLTGEWTQQGIPKPLPLVLTHEK